MALTARSYVAATCAKVINASSRKIIAQIPSTTYVTFCRICKRFSAGRLLQHNQASTLAWLLIVKSKRRSDMEILTQTAPRRDLLSGLKVFFGAPPSGRASRSAESKGACFASTPDSHRHATGGQRAQSGFLPQIACQIVTVILTRSVHEQQRRSLASPQFSSPGVTAASSHRLSIRKIANRRTDR